MRRLAFLLILGSGVIACQPERSAVVEPNAGAQAPMTVAEEELMIDNLNNGVSVGGEVTLDPYDQATWDRLRPPNLSGGFSHIALAELGRTWDFGWFDPVATDGGCRGDIAGGETETNQLLVNGYLNQNGRTRTPNTPAGGWDYEVHPTNTSALERHCIRPGKYTISNGEQTFVIEYIAPESNASSSYIPITHTHIRGTTEAIEADQYTISDSYIDLGVTFEHVPGNWTETRLLEIDNAGGNRLLSTFANANPVMGTGTDWFRFSTANSATNFPADGRALFLSRLFYDYGVNQTIRTEYYDITAASGLIRTHQFGSHVSGSRCVIVGFELKRPDEQPAPVADATRQIGINTTCPTGPDLMPMPISMAPDAVNPGSATTVAFREHNVGTTAIASAWTGHIYLSSDATCCAGDVDLGSFSGAASIAAGSYADMSSNVTIPTGTAGGQYYVFAKLDDPGAIAEGNESNNAQAQVTQLTVVVPQPDLTPSPVTFTPASVQAGGALNVTVRELNQGNATAGSGWQGKIYLSSDNSCCTGDVQLDVYTETNTINGAGGFIDKVRPVTIPGGTASGTYYVFASLDAAAQITESNELNNIFAAATTLSVTAAGVNACATFERTTTWKMSDQIFNAGCSTTGPNIQYRWQTTTGGPWTPYSTSTQYEFLGHAAAGTYSVTVEAKDLSTGVFDTTKYTFTVQNSQITMTGQTNVTVKQNYTYTASPSSTWWERVVPNTTWTGGAVTGTTWQRTWGLGCYYVDVRADATAGGSVLKRGRLTVWVHTEPNCEIP